MQSSNTPIEVYTLNGITIDVKRDDMFATPPSPPNAKMRGIIPLLSELKSLGITRVAVFDTRISEASWGVSVEARKHRMQCVAYYPKSKYVPRSLEHVLSAGASVEYVRHNVTPVCYHEAKKHAGENGLFMLPFGLATKFAVDSVAQEVVATIKPSHYKSVVVCSGSGTMLAGLVTGFTQLGGALPQFNSVSAGASQAKQFSALKRWIDLVPPVRWVPPVMDYYERCDCGCPFPANRWYDCKAFKWLSENVQELEQPILFWNIGAES